MTQTEINQLRQLQPDRAWLESRLNRALNRIAELEDEIKTEHEKSVGLLARYTKLAQTGREYLRDAYAGSRHEFMKCLEDAPR